MLVEKKSLSAGEIDQTFKEICARFQPDIIGEIGSRDCLDAKALKEASPRSQVFAFEASPENFFDYCCEPEILRSGVMPQLVAISDQIGVAEINIPHYASSQNGGKNLQQRGMSSLLKKEHTVSFVTYPVPQTTVDRFFEVPRAGKPDLTFAFWIDVEGLALEVLAGMKQCLPHTLALKIELEDVPYYQGQSLSKDSRDVLAGAGFYEAFQTASEEQFDIIFLRNDIRL
jgi:FkbM family methyltransferase